MIDGKSPDNSFNKGYIWKKSNDSIVRQQEIADERVIMDLAQLKWTKNIKPTGDEPWAYSRYGKDSLFKLAWKDNEVNASKPQRGDLILLRQQGYVTHLVRVLDHKPEREPRQGEFNIYRIVEVAWVIDWANPQALAKAEILFDYASVLKYEGGDIMELVTLPTFQNRWGIDIIAFHERVKTTLNLI